MVATMPSKQSVMDTVKEALAGVFDKPATEVETNAGVLCATWFAHKCTVVVRVLGEEPEIRIGIATENKSAATKRFPVKRYGVLRDVGIAVRDYADATVAKLRELERDSK